MFESVRVRRSSVFPEHKPAATSVSIISPSACDLVEDNTILTHLPKPDDCFKTIKEFADETAKYHTMVTALGTVPDGPSLRQELYRTRRKACHLARVNRNKLLPHLKRRTRTTVQEQQQYERMWNLFSTCLELLHLELCKTISLLQSFPISNCGNALIATGLTDALKHLPRQSRLSIVSISTENAALYDDVLLLKRDHTDTLTMMTELENSVDVKPWMFEPDPETSKLYDSHCQTVADYETASSTGATSVEISWGDRKRRCVCLSIIVLVTVLVFASVIAVCIALFT